MTTGNEGIKTIEPAGKFVPTPEMDRAGDAWLSLTDEQRSELLHQRRHGHVPVNSLPQSEPEEG